MHLVGVRVDGRLAGIGGVELQDAGVAELKRMYVLPGHRGSRVADALRAALVEQPGGTGSVGALETATSACRSRHGGAGSSSAMLSPTG